MTERSLISRVNLLTKLEIPNNVVTYFMDNDLFG